MVSGSEHLESLASDRPPLILAFWHNQLVGAGCFLLPLTLRAGVRVGSLVSLSKDGELTARMARFWGHFELERGSTTRGGLGGLRRLHRAISRRGVSVALAPDGPTGPIYEVKSGALVLAQSSQAPVVPMAAIADRYWRLGSWDRIMVPKPFARLAVVAGEPMSVPRRQTSEELQARSEELGRRLDDASDRARTAGGPKPSRTEART